MIHGYQQDNHEDKGDHKLRHEGDNDSTFSRDGGHVFTEGCAM